VTATSSAIGRSVVRLLGLAPVGSPAGAGEGALARRPRLAAISPLTAAALAEVGAPADAVASEYTADGVVAAILAAEQRAG
ncbi:MAG: uroporphyrinogen-III synthase, partial [Lacipirellulaceae bacterium]